MPRANILVIEDNPSDIFLLRRALIAAYGENFSLEIVPDGERALELIQSPNGIGLAPFYWTCTFRNMTVWKFYEHFGKARI